MATYTTLRIGSRGDDVRKLQTSLGFTGKDVDGIYGNKTAAAVRDYQSANGLKVDGIAGNQTLGSLYGGATATPQATTAPSTTPAVSPTTYKDNEAAVSKRADLDALLDSKPGEYKSGYGDMIEQLADRIMNREKFSYDLNGDALYQQYKDQFINQGKLAMQDTIGQAAAMTGGYGNSYAQSVGQQTFQGYLQQLNDKVPELYQLALNQYNQEGDDMYKQFSLLADREETEYGRHRDEVADWNADRAFTYGEYRDAVGDSQWQAGFDEQVRQYEQEYKLKVEEIEEAKRHNLISEDQAQQQIDLAKRELSIKSASAKVAKAADPYKLTKEQEDRFYGLVADGEWAKADNFVEYLKENGLSDGIAGALLQEIPKEYWDFKEGKLKGPAPKNYYNTVN